MHNAHLPAESQFATEQGVALGTMRRALELLAEQGFIERIHGKGTFVRQGLSGAINIPLGACSPRS